MFKKCFLIAVFAMFSIATFAQDSNFGVNAGYLNIKLTGKSNASGLTLSDSDSKSGFYVGVFGEGALTDNFSLRGEVNYGLVNDTNFLMVPIMAKYYFAQSNLFVQAGPQVSFVLEDLGGFLNTVGVDATGGLGYDISDHFVITARYAHELTNRIPSDRADFYGNSSIKIHSFTLGVGYRF